MSFGDLLFRHRLDLLVVYQQPVDVQRLWLAESVGSKMTAPRCSA
jgi:hypothetical protein